MAIDISAVPSGRREELIKALKRAAKIQKKKFSDLKLSYILDQIAAASGYNNWSLLHKDICNMSTASFQKLEAHFLLQLAIEFPPKAQVLSAQEESIAVSAMRTWVEGKFTRLIEFAYHDSESENGYSWADEDISYALQEEFSEQYPLDLIEKVAADLEVNHGPWGIEEY
jgi:hypothetical protein